LPAKARWTIVKADPTTRRIEASEQSFWMGFTDDTVVRVAEVDSGSRIDVRSTSRHGRSDLGVNAAPSAPTSRLFTTRRSRATDGGTRSSKPSPSCGESGSEIDFDRLTSV
jgi:Protein of unknown function (DUF1499)